MTNTIRPERKSEILHNRGCGMSYLQRNQKIPYSQVSEDSWFLMEDLTDKLAIDVPWCLLEPEEGRYDWGHSEWEGCFLSWLDAGYKVHLKVRGMGTLGTLYNDGVPQWVFDAGAKYIDDPISLYRREKVLLNNIPAKAKLPIRYPVYWDPVYIEKAERFIHEFGRRYNGHPAVESVSIAHLGRWGEMHIGDRGPMEPWLAAGFSVAAFNKALIRFIDIYRIAFPNTQLSLSIGAPAFYSEYSFADVIDVLDYAASHEIMLKFDGLGNSFEPGSTPFLCKSVSDIFRKNRYRTKLAFENLVLPEALDEALAHGISYWQRGGESGGLGIARVVENVPVFHKLIFSWYSVFPSRYDTLTIEQQKDCFRKMARKCGYLLGLKTLTFDQAPTVGQSLISQFKWYNHGYAPCFEKFKVKLALWDSNRDQEVWSESQAPGIGLSAAVWDAEKNIDDVLSWHLPAELQPGNYELQVGVQLCAYNREMMNLDLNHRSSSGMYDLGRIIIKK